MEKNKNTFIYWEASQPPLHYFSCPGHFGEAALHHKAGKVPEGSLSRQIISICSGSRGAEMHTQTPSCRCSVDSWKAHSCGQSTQPRLSEQAVGRVRGLLSGRLTSSISCGFPSFQKEKWGQVAESPYIILLSGLDFTGVHKWARCLSLPFRLQAKTPMLVSFSWQYVFMQSNVAKDFSMPNGHGRVH